jgi:hypothetical protein
MGTAWRGQAQLRESRCLFRCGEWRQSPSIAPIRFENGGEHEAQIAEPDRHPRGRGCFTAVVMNYPECLSPARVSRERHGNKGYRVVVPCADRLICHPPGALVLRPPRSEARHSPGEGPDLAFGFVRAWLLDLAFPSREEMMATFSTGRRGFLRSVLGLLKQKGP